MSLTSSLLPLTRMVLKPYVTLYTIKGGAFFQSPAAFAQALASNSLGNLILIGATEEFEPKYTRATNGDYAELNADPNSGSFGSPIEAYPGLPHYTLSLKRVMLHDSNMLEAFGFVGSDIIHQNVPIILQSIKPVPQDSNGDPLVIDGKPLQVRVDTYPCCWFDQHIAKFSVTESDLKIIQEVTITCIAPISNIVLAP